MFVLSKRGKNEKTIRISTDFDIAEMAIRYECNNLLDVLYYQLRIGEINFDDYRTRSNEPVKRMHSQLKEIGVRV
jgi:FKBP-type peptidyl-prolyl cis-trans isomerase (trigger factor)